MKYRGQTVHVRKISLNSYRSWVNGGPVHKTRNKTAAIRAAKHDIGGKERRRRRRKHNPIGAGLAVGLGLLGVGAALGLAKRFVR